MTAQCPLYPQWIGPHRRGDGAIGEQIQLLFLDPVLHLAAGTEPTPVRLIEKLPRRH